MIFTPHLLFGAAIASGIMPLSLGLFLAFLSHFLLDAIPHWDYPTKNIKGRSWKKSYPEFLQVAMDFSMGSAFIIAFAPQKLIAVTGGLIAASPDTLTLLAILLPACSPLQKFWKLHDSVHWFRRAKIALFWRIASQIMIIILSVWLLSR